MEILKNNLEALKKSRYDIYSVIKDADFDYDKEIACCKAAKNNEAIITYQYLDREEYLNSKYNPANEVQKYMSELLDMPDESILVMFGMANGQFAKEFITKKKNNTMCVIYEPSIEIFMTVLNNIDITDLIDEAIIVVKGINDTFYSYCLSKTIQSYNMSTNKILALPKYATIFAKDYEDVHREYCEHLERFAIITNTAINVGKDVCANDIHNMLYLGGCRSARDYVDYFPEDLPVIIVSAGPSLANNIDELKKARGKALIVVVDTAINKAYASGIVPDMVSTIDYVKPIKYFEAKGLDEVPILLEMDVNYKVLDFLRPKNAIFASSDSLVWDDAFKKAGGEIYSVDAGGSVATFTIANMISWGFKKIILIGQDLSFPGNVEHVGEAAQKFDDDSYKYMQVDAIGGGKILTRKDFYAYIKWIEETAFMYNDVEIVDATEGGALIGNTTVMTLSAAIEKYCTKEYDIAGLIGGVRRLFVDGDEGIIYDKFISMKDNLNEIKAIMDDVSKECKVAYEMLSNRDFNKTKLQIINEKMTKADELLLESEERSLINKYITSSEFSFTKDLFVEEDDEIKEAIRLYEKSEAYYRDIADAVPEIVSIIDECMIQYKEKMRG